MGEVPPDKHQDCPSSGPIQYPTRNTWPVASPSTASTYARAASATGTGVAPWNIEPYSSHASSNTVALTALMRMPRGSSSAADRTKASMPPSTVDATALVRTGSTDRMPDTSENEPPSATCGRPSRTSSTWPSSLSRTPASHWSEVSSARGPYGVLPAVHTTASTCPTEV